MGKGILERFTSLQWYCKVFVVCASFVIAMLLFFIAIDANLFGLFGRMPSADQIEKTAQCEASEVYSADGRIMGKYFSENRSPVNDTSEVSPQLITTLIRTEDTRFYQHHGIDFRGLLSALKDAYNGKARGASTLTQQLAKNLFKMRSSRQNDGLLCRVKGLGMLITKCKEWITALKLEARYSKPQILTMYLNTVDFGSNALGIRTAAKTYFGVSPRDLTFEQSAVLVGLLKATSYYNPKLNPDNALQRRNIVLQNLVESHDLTQKQCDRLCRKPIRLRYNVEGNYDGWGLYFRRALADELKPWCAANGYNLYTSGLRVYTTIDYDLQRYAELAVRKHMREVQRRFNNHWDKRVPWENASHREIPGFVENVARRTESYRALLKKSGGNDAVAMELMNKKRRMKVFAYNIGGRDTVHYYDNGKPATGILHRCGIIDTLLSPMDSIRYMLRFMHASFVAMEPRSGHVKAWVGDLSFEQWKYDKVRAYRQPGSVFKLFDYAEAFNQGLSPCDERVDDRASYPVWDRAKNARVRWCPHNSDGVSTGTAFSLKSAFARSINTIAVKVSMEIGIPNINRTAVAMGLKHLAADTAHFDTIPSTCLGACEESLEHLVNAYCTVMNDGYYHDPVFVTRIEDRLGNVIYRDSANNRQVLDYEVAFLMQDMLRGGLTEHNGTTGALWEYIHPVLFSHDNGKKVKNEFGGKTGTSSNHSDAWFIGATPGLVAGCWVGGEYRSIHFRTGELGQGSRTALPIYGYFMRYVLQDPRFNNRQDSASYYGGMFPRPRQRIRRNYNCRQYSSPSDRSDDDEAAAADSTAAAN